MDNLTDEQRGSFWTDRHIDGQTGRQTGRQTERQTERKMKGLADRDREREIER